MGGNEAPVWWADWPNVARDLPAAGMLDLCTASNTCPQVLETWGGNEFYINKMGADVVSFCQEPPSSIACTTEIPQPAKRLSILCQRCHPWRQRGELHLEFSYQRLWQRLTQIGQYYLRLLARRHRAVLIVTISTALRASSPAK